MQTPGQERREETGECSASAGQPVSPSPPLLPGFSSFLPPPRSRDDRPPSSSLASPVISPFSSFPAPFLACSVHDPGGPRRLSALSCLQPSIGWTTGTQSPTKARALREISTQAAKGDAEQMPVSPRVGGHGRAAVMFTKYAQGGAATNEPRKAGPVPATRVRNGRAVE